MDHPLLDELYEARRQSVTAACLMFILALIFFVVDRGTGFLFSLFFAVMLFGWGSRLKQPLLKWAALPYLAVALWGLRFLDIPGEGDYFAGSWRGDHRLATARQAEQITTVEMSDNDALSAAKRRYLTSQRGCQFSARVPSGRAPSFIRTTAASARAVSATRCIHGP